MAELIDDDYAARHSSGNGMLQCARRTGLISIPSALRSFRFPLGPANVFSCCHSSYGVRMCRAHPPRGAGSAKPTILNLASVAEGSADSPLLSTRPALRSLDGQLALFFAGKPTRSRHDPEATQRHNLPGGPAFDRVYLHDKVGVPIIDSDPPAAVTLRAGGQPIRNNVRVVVQGEARSPSEWACISVAYCDELPLLAPV